MALKIVSGLDATSLSLSSFLDLQKNELRNAQIQNLTTTQIAGVGTPASGQFAYDSTLNKLKVYNGSAWELVGASADGTTIELSSNTLTIKDGGVTGAKMAALTIATGNIANLAVTSGKLAASAVGTAKLADDAVTTAKIADAQITTDLIATDAVTAAKIADNSINIARLNTSDGSAGQFLKTDGSGTLSFATPPDSDVALDTLATRLSEIATDHMSGSTIIIGSSTNTPDVQVTGDLTVDGDLVVGGTTTTINSTTVTIDDPIFTLGGDTAPTEDDNKDRGIEFRYHDGTSAKLGFFGYDDSAREFVAYVDATNTAEVFSGTLAAAKFGSVDASIITTAISLGGTTITSTAAELNTLDGFTGAVADLNYAKALKATGVTTTEFDKLDGLTPTTTELNYVDGVTSAIQTQLNAKPKAYSASIETSSGTFSVNSDTHGIAFPANVQVYDENGQLVLVDIRQAVESGVMTITINAPDATYTMVAIGGPIV